MIIGRKEEIAKLNSFYESDKAGFAVVTGSYGIGKTSLLREFAEDKEAYIYDAYETTGKHQLELFSQTFGIETGANIDKICSRITELAKKNKILLIIDQYPNIQKSNAEFDKVLFNYYNNEWQNLPIKIVFCGDAYILMEKYVLAKKALWKDSIDLHIDLKPLGFYESCQFFNNDNIEESLFLYGITGGIPYNLVRSTGDIKKDTISLFLDKQRAVGLNPEKLMSTELREMAYYNHMLTALASGLNRVNQISEEVGKPKDVVVPYLNTLMTIGICTKDTAITEATNRKKTRYSIVNTSTVFWYKYIVPNIDLYAKGAVQELWKEVMKNKEEFLQLVFIRTCQEYLIEAARLEKLPFTIEQTGNWWVNDDETGTTQGFDIVSLGKSEGKSATIYCQCFYNDSEVEIAQLKSLIDMTKQLHRQGDAFYLVFSKAGFNENAITVSATIKNIMLISLNEMELE